MSRQNEYQTGHLSGSLTTPTLREDYVELIADLTGVTNVMIPVSTLEFLFQRFNMIEKQLDALKSHENRSTSSPGCPAVLAGVDTADNGKLATRISALEETIEKQSILLSDMDSKCNLLLEDNASLKNALNDVKHADNISSANQGISLDNNPIAPDKCISSSPVSIVAPSNNFKILSTSRDTDNSEICITNFINKQNFNFENVAFAVVSTILPSVTSDDILSCRPATRKDHKGGSRTTSLDCLTSIFIKLRCPSLVAEIIRAKKKFNLLQTRDLDLSAFDQEGSTKILPSNIYFNEVLSTRKRDRTVNDGAESERCCH